MKGVTLEMLNGPGVESLTINGVRLGGAIEHFDGRQANRLTEPPEESEKQKLFEFSHGPLGVFTIPCVIRSEANIGGSMRAAIGRKKAVKDAIWRHLGPYWRVWGPIGDGIRADRPGTIQVTRIGKRPLDTANLWRALKPVEDALAILLGCNDGSEAWVKAYRVHQEKSDRYGVRITLEAAQ